MTKAEDYLTGDPEQDSRRVSYVLFISAVSVLAFIVALAYYIVPDPEVRQVLLILDTIYSFVFLLDFLAHLRFARDKKGYMLRFGWLDLLTSVPGFPALRILRSVLVVREARALLEATPEAIEDAARERIGESVLLVTVFVGLIVVSIGSILIVSVEADAPGATITSGQDALWWSLVTISTVGYGDEVPVTTSGRVIGAFMIVVGVALFTTLTSYLASSYTDRGAAKQRAQQIALAQENQAKMEEMLRRILELEERLSEAAEDGGDGQDGRER